MSSPHSDQWHGREVCHRLSIGPNAAVTYFSLLILVSPKLPADIYPIKMAQELVYRSR